MRSGKKLQLQKRERKRRNKEEGQQHTPAERICGGVLLWNFRFLLREQEEVRILELRCAGFFLPVATNNRYTKCSYAVHRHSLCYRNNIVLSHNNSILGQKLDNSLFMSGSAFSTTKHLRILTKNNFI